jgi:hypothetical protein
MNALPVDTGSRAPAGGGSPVIIRLPNGRLVYNAANSGSVWVNELGRLDGVWKEYQTTLGGGYSRNLQYVENTGRVVILRNQGQSQIAFGEVDLGRSAGSYTRLINRKTDQALGTGNNTNDANLGNADNPDVVLEPVGAATNRDTQYWHVMFKPDGGVTLLNKSGGRAASVWGGNPGVGTRIGQWVDDTAGGTFNLIMIGNGYYRLQAAKNTSVYLTGATDGAPITLQSLTTDGSQDWKLTVG